MVDIKKKYNENGYYLAKSVFTNDFCDELKSHLATLEPKVHIPFSNIPYGYGNLLNKGPFEKVTENNFIKKMCKELIKGDGFRFNHLVI